MDKQFLIYIKKLNKQMKKESQEIRNSIKEIEAIKRKWSGEKGEVIETEEDGDVQTEEETDDETEEEGVYKLIGTDTEEEIDDELEDDRIAKKIKLNFQKNDITFF